MQRIGSADLPLHGGSVPYWLSSRMEKLGRVITESIVHEYGLPVFLERISDPFWFQSFGSVMGMDWHSSGITTAVMAALKKGLNPISQELGIYVCGGKGKQSLQTPVELLRVGEQTGLDGNHLARCSRLSAKVDNTAVQDGFQLYIHYFIVTRDGHWSVIQQGMNDGSSTARRYHWHSEQLHSFVDEPHLAVLGQNQGHILNLTDHGAMPSRDAILDITHQPPATMIKEINHLVMPGRHEVAASDINLKRLGAMLWLTHENPVTDFEELMLLKGVGPRTLQSLTLVSEVIYGTPSRFNDPARFSFAHGGKDGNPFPVPLKVFDETIAVVKNAVEKAQLGVSDRLHALKQLSVLSEKAEENFIPNNNFEQIVQKERDDSWKYGGRTVFGVEKPPPSRQLKLFE